MVRTGRVWDQLLISVEPEAQDPAHEVRVEIGRRRARSDQGNESDKWSKDTRLPL